MYDIVRRKLSFQIVSYALFLYFFVLPLIHISTPIPDDDALVAGIDTLTADVIHWRVGFRIVSIIHADVLH